MLLSPVISVFPVEKDGNGYNMGVRLDRESFPTGYKILLCFQGMIISTEVSTVSYLLVTVHFRANGLADQHAFRQHW